MDTAHTCMLFFFSFLPIFVIVCAHTVQTYICGMYSCTGMYVYSFIFWFPFLLTGAEEGADSHSAAWGPGRGARDHQADSDGGDKLWPLEKGKGTTDPWAPSEGPGNGLPSRCCGKLGCTNSELLKICCLPRVPSVVVLAWFFFRISVATW